MRQFLIILFSLLFSSTSLAQKSSSVDSLFQLILQDVPESLQSELIRSFNSSSEQDKEFLVLMLSMPKSSKSKLIRNLDSNFDKIIHLVTEYSKLVPKNYNVSIEFNPENKLTKMKESIDLKIETRKKLEGMDIEYRDISQEWNMEYNSIKLAEMMTPVKWNAETLKIIKKLLSDANCISIENGEITTIGFARSGMGKYFFKIFTNNLSAGEITKYNDGCTYIFYKKNIVLEYGGGAVGSQCFPD